MLKRQALKATAWSGADVLLRQGLQFAVTIVLARLLTPEEFGTVALLYLFTGLAAVLVDGGMSTALIQRQDTTHVDESTVFWFNVCVGLIMAVLLASSAGWIATYFDSPILVPLAMVMGVSVLASALGAVHLALLTKRLDFRTQMKAGAAAALLSGLVSITMAWRGFGVWALVAQILVMSSTTTMLLWFLHRWRPLARFSLHSARRLFGFGGYLLLANLLDMIYTRAYTLLIGRHFGVRELGFYDRADQTKQLPVSWLTSSLSRVALPLFSAAAHDRDKLRRGVQVATRALMLINVPMMLGLAALAEPTVLLLFGENWRPAAPIFSVLCLAAVLWPLHVVNLNALMAQGHARIVLRLEIPKKLIGIGMLLAGMLYGVMGIAWSQVAFSAAALIVNALYTGRLLGYGLMMQVRDNAAVFALGTLMAAGVYMLSKGWQAAPALKIAVLAPAGALFFLSAALLLRLPAALETLAVYPGRRTHE